jgi:hypothetical protein
LNTFQIIYFFFTADGAVFPSQETVFLIVYSKQISLSASPLVMLINTVLYAIVALLLYCTFLLATANGADLNEKILLHHFSFLNYFH